MTFLLHGPSSFSTLWRRTLHQHIPRIPFYDRIEDIPISSRFSTLPHGTPPKM